MTAQKADPLYVSYMEAFSASTLHTRDCTACQNGEHCAVGAPIHKAFAKAQDAYQVRQSAKRRS
ncbi:hypothetical protein OG906_42810 (plasmid) [Streptomyces sp. NBC_01426]|uniref:hypothetical protein n=1 Tax=Streptomyces sp. NBC_01426 TaxID=2975866 RepID=UPI002E3303B4|nr:hypothetical protein [Streptomyces sp. NBC_01426]